MTLVVPFVELFKPGQPAPYSEFPYLALAILAAATVIACVVVHRHPSTDSSEGAFSESWRGALATNPLLPGLALDGEKLARDRRVNLLPR